eukprot:TRINITY_DN4141_c0_g1_i1.p1 TRINITY_DN4141_c0_g1~~TRINITY_DN4141_c0_g1_i1.p1  ORF type:complete len:249 (-),score=35.39 TRINITY_DN4141_c0_g1_i1:13-759(-)
MIPLSRNKSFGFGVGGYLPEYLRRMVQFPQMDMEYTFWQMIHLCFAPQKMYRNTVWHKQTKNQWARDDPGFLAILIYLLSVSSLAFCICYQVSGFFSIFRIMFWTVFVDFISFGILISFCGWLIANKYLRVQGGVHNVDQKVEFLYSFDIHCNGFFPLFLQLYVVQFFMLPLLTQPGLLYTFLANSLYFVAASYYLYISFLGYSALPFLQNTLCFLYPIFLVFFLYFFSLILNFNMSIFVMNIYFGDV